ncbi:holo-ACP synthase [Herbaspirillum sp. RTI4]|uniref:holo-ACP synthase n=1 Tax=Herbaspirillum sp. RTI4 TaxID=3048640 RepID=UPI002AB435E6|nr:holo-ACP synthase [Herbaspirillum sp. RTI4]MDY7578504.1 holo-ACP synthase [Herbaspirillum sp. RTI4]MEA9981467.1 holo-ACP synthase [Herbaspirillum sp. RTI4]
MIYGIGTDIIRIARIEAALKRNGDRFAERILGAEEMEKYRDRTRRVEARGIRFLATRFAAKEAFSKAIGLGMRMPMTWRSMQVLNAPSGKPVVVASGALKDWMESSGITAQVTLTDEAEYAVAFVIAEKA